MNLTGTQRLSEEAESLREKSDRRSQKSGRKKENVLTLNSGSVFGTNSTKKTDSVGRDDYYLRVTEGVEQTQPSKGNTEG